MATQRPELPFQPTTNVADSPRYFPAVNVKHFSLVVQFGRHQETCHPERAKDLLLVAAIPPSASLPFRLHHYPFFTRIAPDGTKPEPALRNCALCSRPGFGTLLRETWEWEYREKHQGTPIKSGSPVQPCVPCGLCFLPTLNQSFPSDDALPRTSPSPNLSLPFLCTQRLFPLPLDSTRYNGSTGEIVASRHLLKPPRRQQ